MTEAERVAGIIGRALPHVKRGTLRFWGSWFGRPYDNLHGVVGCRADGELLTVHFDQDQVLRVWAPRGVTVGEEHFQIEDATRVRWEWFYYGRPKTQANLYFEDFRADGAETRAETNVDWFVPSLQINPSMPAVEIL